MKIKHPVLFCSLRRTALATLAGVGALAGPAQAQEAEPASIPRVEITGSSIKRIDAEGALPVTVLTAADIRASGVTSVADLVRKLRALGDQHLDGAVDLIDLGAHVGQRRRGGGGLGDGGRFRLGRLARFGVCGSGFVRLCGHGW